MGNFVSNSDRAAIEQYRIITAGRDVTKLGLKYALCHLCQL